MKMSKFGDNTCNFKKEVYKAKHNGFSESQITKWTIKKQTKYTSLLTSIHKVPILHVRIELTDDKTM